MAERVDVCIVGSGFGGSISAFRLSELYRAAGVDAKNILVLEGGARYKHTAFPPSMPLDNLARVYNLIQSSGGAGSVTAPGPNGVQVVTANAVGGGSNLYLAASLRSPQETFERRDHRADDGEDRRMWPKQISRKTLDPYYARAEAGLRVRRPTWGQVSKSGGLWAATLNAAGHTCDRVPLAIDPHRCVDAKWCHTGCIFGAKNTLNTNYLASAERAGVRVRPNMQAESIRRSTSAGGYRYVVSASVIDNDGPSPPRQPVPGQSEEIECKVLILAAGAMGNSPLLMRSRPNLPSLSDQVGKHVGSNGDHIAGVEYDPAKIRRLLHLPGYGEFHKGKPITPMPTAFWVGRRAHRYDGPRFSLQEIFLSSLTNALYDDGRAPAGDPSWWGLQKKQSIATWNNHIELLAMVEDTHDGTFLAPPPNGGAVRPNTGPVAIAPFTYELSDESIAGGELADKAMRQIGERNGLARFMPVTETQGIYASHPLGGCRMGESKELGGCDHRRGGCRMGESKELGVGGHRCEAFENEGLFCMDSSAIPTSLGVNPSLTISAVVERAAEALVARGADLGLPARPAGFRHRTPGVYVGERVIPDRRHQAA